MGEMEDAAAIEFEVEVTAVAGRLDEEFNAAVPAYGIVEAGMAGDDPTILDTEEQMQSFARVEETCKRGGAVGAAFGMAPRQSSGFGKVPDRIIPLALEGGRGVGVMHMIDGHGLDLRNRMTKHEGSEKRVKESIKMSFPVGWCWGRKGGNGWTEIANHFLDSNGCGGSAAIACLLAGRWDGGDSCGVRVGNLPGSGLYLSVD